MPVRSKTYQDYYKKETSGQHHESIIDNRLWMIRNKTLDFSFSKAKKFYTPQSLVDEGLVVEEFKVFDFLVSYKNHNLIIEAKFQQSNGSCHQKIISNSCELGWISEIVDFKTLVVCNGKILDKKFISSQNSKLKKNNVHNYVLTCHLDDLEKEIFQWIESINKTLN